MYDEELVRIYSAQKLKKYWADLVCRYIEIHIKLTHKDQKSREIVDNMLLYYRHTISNQSEIYNSSKSVRLENFITNKDRFKEVIETEPLKYKLMRKRGIIPVFEV